MRFHTRVLRITVTCWSILAPIMSVAQPPKNPSSPNATDANQSMASLLARKADLERQLQQYAVEIYGKAGNIVESQVDTTVSMLGTLFPPGDALAGLSPGEYIKLTQHADSLAQAWEAAKSNDWETVMKKSYSVISDVGIDVLSKGLPIPGATSEEVSAAASVAHDSANSTADPSMVGSLRRSVWLWEKSRAVITELGTVNRAITVLDASSSQNCIICSDQSGSTVNPTSGSDFDPSSLSPEAQKNWKETQKIVRNETLQPTDESSSDALSRAAAEGDPLAKALNQVITKEMGATNDYTPDMLIPESDSPSTLQQSAPSQGELSRPLDLGGQDSSGGIVIDDSQLVPDSSAPANGIAVETQFVSNPTSTQGLDASSGFQVSSELVDDHPYAGLSVVDGGPPTQPQDAASPTSGGRWGRWQDWLQLGFIGLQGWQQWNAAHPTIARSPAPTRATPPVGKGKATATGWQNQARSKSNSICGPGYYVNPNFLAGLPWTPGQSVCIVNGTSQPYAGPISQGTKQPGQAAPQPQKSTPTTPSQDPCQAEANAAFSAPTIGAFSYLMTLYQSCENAHNK